MKSTTVRTTQKMWIGTSLFKISAEEKQDMYKN